MSENCEPHFGDLELAFFAAGDVEPAPVADQSAAEVFDEVPEAPRRTWRQRLVPVYRLGRLWLTMRLRLLLAVLRDAVPSAVERFSPLRLARPLLVRSGEIHPRLYIRRPVLTVAAAVVLASTLVSVWAGVVLAATRLGG